MIQSGWIQSGGPVGKIGDAFEQFVEIIAALRHPETGCPWDLEQTHQSIKPHLLEESCEALDAIDEADDEELRGELGDVLLQVVLHSQLGAERSAFDIAAVISGISEKIIRRHPHVFGEEMAKTSADVQATWKKVKQIEEERSGKGPRSILAKFPRSLPALMRADLIGKKTAEFDFDWHKPEDVWSKVEEEMSEVKSEVSKSVPNDEASKRRLRQELGDLLFALAQYARHLGIDPEFALRETNDRFCQRFAHIERSLGTGLKDASYEKKEVLWQEAKELEYLPEN